MLLHQRCCYQHRPHLLGIRGRGYRIGAGLANAFQRLGRLFLAQLLRRHRALGGPVVGE